MTAPGWLAAMLADFGRGMGLGDLALNAQGAAALTFETGVQLRFEYFAEALTVAVTVPADVDSPALARRVLAVAHPEIRRAFRVRAGLLAKSRRAVFAVRLAERAVTRPALEAVFNDLWRVAEDMRNGG